MSILYRTLKVTLCIRDSIRVRQDNLDTMGKRVNLALVVKLALGRCLVRISTGKTVLTEGFRGSQSFHANPGVLSQTTLPCFKFIIPELS